MSRRTLVPIVAFLAGALIGAVPAHGDDVVDQEVRAALARGPVRVLVELRLPDDGSGSGGSPPRDPGSRTTAIATARQAVLERLAATTFRPIRQYTTVPLLALEVGADAVRALEAMGDLVVRVRLDRLRSPSGTP